jgi:hypothetical protein
MVIDDQNGNSIDLAPRQSCLKHLNAGIRDARC